MEAQAGQWLAQGDPAAAAAVLSPAEPACAGQESFDHLLGFALLRSDQPEAASWVLERAVAANPDNGAAWLDLADACLRQGEEKRAQEALQRARALAPPAAARDKISALQDALQRQSATLHAEGYLALEEGWDSNVNSATDLGTISAPGISPVPFQLDPDSRRGASPYRDADLGGQLSWHATPALTLYLQSHLKFRHYTRLPRFDRGITGWQGGAGRQLGNTVLLGMLRLENQTLGGKNYLNSQGGSLEWRVPLSPRSMVSVVTQYQATRYAAFSMHGYDSDQLLAGLAYTQTFLSDRLRWQLAGYRGADDAVSGRAGGSRRLIILATSLDYRLPRDWTAHLSLSHEADDYQKTDPAFLVAHRESVWNYTVGLDWQFAHRQTLSIFASDIRDDANIPLYSSHRQMLGSNWRVDF